jgi:predicted nucleic acid-binding protein
MPEYGFVDSSFLVARFNVRDRNHKAAIAYLEEQRAAGSDALRLVFSDYIFDETVTALVVRSRRHELASAAGRAILESKNLRLVRVESPTFEAAWKLFVRRSDKRWSFTDCTSFVLMENLGIRKALTFDANFRQAGIAMFP